MWVHASCVVSGWKAVGGGGCAREEVMSHPQISFRPSLQVCNAAQLHCFTASTLRMEGLRRALLSFNCGVDVVNHYILSGECVLGLGTLQMERS